MAACSSAFSADLVLGADLEELTNIEDRKQDKARKLFEIARLEEAICVRPVIKERQSVELILVERKLFEGRGERYFFFEFEGLVVCFLQHVAQGADIVDLADTMANQRVEVELTRWDVLHRDAWLASKDEAALPVSEDADQFAL